MIPIKRKSSIQTIGEVQKNSIGIDASNLDFIVTLLTTNLYKNPLDSAVREIVSNAVDSHKEANIKEPVIILLEDDIANNDNYILTIRDFGVGISEERFNNVYKFLGSSTKRESNKFIGMYGIGKFSPLAYTDTVLIKSIYKGIEYSYIMYKNSQKIQIDLLSKKEVDEKNGLEVSFDIKSGDLLELRKSLKRLVLIPDIYIRDNTINSVLFDVPQMNSRKINTYKDFKTVDNISSKYRYYDSFYTIAIGNILYDIEKSKFPIISSFEDTFLNGLPESLIPVFKIGEIETSPSREDILYNTKNIKVISKKIKDIKELLENKAKKKLKPDYNNFKQFIQNYDSVKISLNDYWKERIKTDNIIKYKGNKLNLEDIKYAINKYPKFNFSVYNRNSFTGDKNSNIDDFFSKKIKITHPLRFLLNESINYFSYWGEVLRDKKDLFFVKRRLTQLDKKYIFSIRKDFDKTKDYFFLEEISYYSILKNIAGTPLDRNHKRFLLDIVKYKYSKIKHYDFEKEITPEVKKQLKVLYPPQRKKSNTNKKTSSKEIKQQNQIGYFKLTESNYRWDYHIYTKSIFKTINDIRKTEKKKVVYIINGEKDDSFKELFKYLKHMYSFIKVFKHDAKYLKDEKGFVYFSDFLKNKDSRPKLNKLANLIKVYQNTESLKNSDWKNIKALEPVNKINNMFYSLPYSLREEEYYINRLIERYFTNIWGTDIEIKELEDLLKKNEKIVKIINKIEEIEGYASRYSRLTMFKSFKLSLIKPSYYLKLKKEYYDRFKD